jgi:drug/metabolite transporter (DMT)-like permease
MAAGAVMLTATATTYWLSALALGRPVLPAQIPAGAWFGLIGIGVVSTFVAVLAFYSGAHRIGAARASIVSTVEPIWTIVLASLLFGERLGPLQLVGGAMILLGVVISQTGRGTNRVSELRIADE